MDCSLAWHGCHPVQWVVGGVRCGVGLGWVGGACAVAGTCISARRGSDPSSLHFCCIAAALALQCWGVIFLCSPWQAACQRYLIVPPAVPCRVFRICMCACSTAANTSSKTSSTQLRFRCCALQATNDKHRERRGSPETATKAQTAEGQTPRIRPGQTKNARAGEDGPATIQQTWRLTQHQQQHQMHPCERNNAGHPTRTHTHTHTLCEGNQNHDKTRAVWMKQGTAVARHWSPEAPRQAFQNNEFVMMLGAFRKKIDTQQYRPNRELLQNLNFCVWRSELIFSKKIVFVQKN